MTGEVPESGATGGTPGAAVYTDADVKRYAKLVTACIIRLAAADELAPIPDQSHAEVRTVLDALVADGRLLPPDGTTRRETRTASTRPLDSGWDLHELESRTITTWPDGSTYTGPWIRAKDGDA